MATVEKQGEWYTVAVDGETLAQFVALLDAHCFALQLIERGMVDEVALLSGVIVPK